MPNLAQQVTMQRADISQMVGTTGTLEVGDHIQMGIRTIGTSEETIVLDSDFVDPGLVYIRNDDADNWLDMGYATSDYPNRLYPGEQAVIPLSLSQDTLYVKADTASVLVQYCAYERQGVTPSTSPSSSPSATPTTSPSASPSTSPSPSPSVSPSATVSSSPSATPTTSPSASPSPTPSSSPSSSAS
jgi:hypothetical protein